MKTHSPDTSLEAERFLIHRLRELPTWGKAQQFKQLTQTCQKMAMVGISKRYPQAGEQELRLRLAALRLDRKIMKSVFHWDPEKEGL